MNYMEDIRPQMINSSGGYALGGVSVVGDCLVSFSREVTPQDRQDIEDSLLYAELEANAKYDRKKDGQKWFLEFCTVLVSINFAPRSLVPRTRKVINSTQELRENIIEIVGKESPRLAEFTRQTYEALKLNDLAKDFFKGDLVDGLAGIVRNAPCEVVEPDTVSVFLCAIHYKAVATYLDYFFWEDITRTLEIVSDGGQYVFDRKRFNVYREPVRRKIAAHVDKYMRLA